MKNAAFYRTLEAKLAGTLGELGFSRQKGRVSRWLLKLPEGRLFLVFRCNPKNPWEPYSGGSFFIEAFFCADDRLAWDEIETKPAMIVDFFSYWPDGDYALLREINRRVYRRVSALRLGDILQAMGLDGSARQAVQLLMQTNLECMRLELDIESDRAVINPNHYYYGEEDVASWGALLERLMPMVVKGVREAPNHPFRDHPEE